MRSGTRTEAVEASVALGALRVVVREKRAAKRMSQVDLAVRSGLHPSVVFRVEAGLTNPGFDTLVRLSRGLGTPLSGLLVRVEEMIEAS